MTGSGGIRLRNLRVGGRRDGGGTEGLEQLSFLDHFCQATKNKIIYVKIVSPGTSRPWQNSTIVVVVVVAVCLVGKGEGKNVDPRERL